MSDTMLFGVLNMPPNYWTGDALDQSQRHSYYKEAAERIYKDGLRIAELEKALQRLASPEAFDVSRAIDPERDKELLMRMEYANTSLMVR